MTLAGTFIPEPGTVYPHDYGAYMAMRLSSNPVPVIVILLSPASFSRRALLGQMDRTGYGMDRPRQQLLELDRRYRLILHSTDHIHPEILDDVQSEVKGRYFAILEEIAEHRRRYPELFAAIEWKYRQAFAGQPVEAEDLVAFGYEENLLLTGEKCNR